VAVRGRVATNRGRNEALFALGPVGQAGPDSPLRVLKPKHGIGLAGNQDFAGMAKDASGERDRLLRRADR
jgi:hypothetical protein